MRLFPAFLLILCLVFCSTACSPAPRDPFAYAAAPFSVTVEGTYLPANDPEGTPRPVAAMVTAGVPIGGDLALRDLTVTFTAPTSLRGVTVTAALSPAADGSYGRAVAFSYPSDYGEVRFTATGNELDGLLRFAEALLPVGDVAEVSPVAEDGSFTIVFLGDGKTDFRLELTALRDHPQKYDLGECEFHLAFLTDDYEAAHKLHEEMGCICFENPAMGIYFISDPDGYWLEIIPTRKG